MLLRPRDDRLERAVDPTEDDAAGFLNCERQRGIEHVRRREAVVEPARYFAELVGDRIDECRNVVTRRSLDLGHALG